jgi:glycosyltransferase involved in cell wall biosynthesis
MAPATSGLGLIRDSFFARIIKKKGVKILYHVHSRLTRGDRRNILFKKLFESMFHKEKAIILGKELRNDMSWVIPDKDIYILPNAIKNEISNNEILGIQKRRRDARAINILFLSNMDKTKGWPKLLEACKILKERGINFSCNFVGAWVAKRDEECFIDFVKKNSLERNVSYLGKKTGAEKNKVFANANVFVFPTEYKLETFGLVILEAMMFALPVISNSIATIPSTIQDEKSGFVLKSNSPNEIAAKLSILASDRNKMESMGNFGRRLFLKKFEQKKYDKELIRIINSSLGTSS